MHTRRPVRRRGRLHTDFGIRLILAQFSFLDARNQMAIRRGEPVTVDLGIPPMVRELFVVEDPSKLPRFRMGWQ